MTKFTSDFNVSKVTLVTNSNSIKVGVWLLEVVNTPLSSQEQIIAEILFK